MYKRKAMSNKYVNRHKHKQSRISDQEVLTIPLTNLDSLIDIAKQNKKYKNIDNATLQRILQPLQELQSIIGMKDLKDSIFYQIIYYIQNLHKKTEDYLHTVILGSPGSGKTTVAKIIANIYCGLGILHEHNIMIAKRSDLVGEYLGQTTIKTNKFLNKCIGGVLFIDEIYSLGPGSKDKKDSYSKEAIDALNIFLSEHKKDFCCIIAGYEKEVHDCFFSVNQGLERRFPWVHKITKYSDHELAQICLKQIKDINWDTTISINDLALIIKENSTIFKNLGGSIENLITRSKMCHAKRVFALDECHKFIITVEDIKNAINQLKENDINEPDNKVLNLMYT